MKLYKTGAMESLRKWFYKPKRDDCSLLAQFFFADDALNMIAAELDSFDGRKDPERCSTLVNQLRNAQDRVLNITTQIMDQLLGSERVPRGFRVKFPEDVLQDNLAGQLWFGAECLAAGSSIMHREEESAAMRPLAKALTRSLETVRALLREHCLRNNQYNGQLIVNDSDEILHESLKIFDKLFAEFELCYVSAMVPVKTPQEFEVQQLICVLFSDTLQRSLKFGLLTQDQVDDYDPALMFAIPRMAIVSGLLIYSSGPLSIIKPPEQMSDMFRPFRTLLYKIRELLWTLDKKELLILEKLLCTNEDISKISTASVADMDTAFYPDINEFITRFASNYSPCRELMDYNWKSKDLLQNSIATGIVETYRANIDSLGNTLHENDYLPDNIEIFTPILDGMRRLGELDRQMAPPQMTVLKSKKKKRKKGVLPENEDHDICIDRGKEGIDDGDTQTFHWMNSIPEATRADTDTNIAPSTSAGAETECNEPMADQPTARNLASNTLSMFDPLAASTSHGLVVNVTHDGNVILPDQNLVTSLSEQVSEIVDKLSNISYDIGEIDASRIHSNYKPVNIQDQVASQIHSYSTNDVSNLVRICKSDLRDIKDDMNDIAITQIPTVPSTSNGFLIPNAISQEPAILASLSQNNSTIFEEDSLNTNSNLRNQIVSDMLETEISSINVNLSSLLLTKEEFVNNFPEESNALSESNDLTLSDDGQNVNSNPDVCNKDRVKFVVGYDNDAMEILTPGDSGVCTENTSPDRSPDSEHGCGELNSREKHVSTCSTVERSDVPKHSSRTSGGTSDNHVTIEISTVRLDYKEDTCNSCKDEMLVSSSPPLEVMQNSNSISKSDVRTSGRSSEPNTKCDINISESASVNMVNLVQESVQGSSEASKLKRKDNIKRKKKESRTKPWSPGQVILANHSNIEQRNAVMLNLEHFVEDLDTRSYSSSTTSSFHSECADDEEIALALQAQELAARYHTRSKFISSEDLIHRLFVCIAGVADQLQTNFAADLRNILKAVFLMNQTQETPEPEEKPTDSLNECVENGSNPNGNDSNKYEVSGSEVIGTGGSFDSIYSAEEVHADSSPDREIHIMDTPVEDDSGNEVSLRTEVSLIGAEAKTSRDDSDEVFDSDVSRGEPFRLHIEGSADSELKVNSDPRDRNVRSQSVSYIDEEARQDSSAVERAPEWVPDIAAPDCMRCSSHFTAFRRRHHCRNCGKVFCASCSANSIPLPRFGQMKPVRVCEECFWIQARIHKHHHHR